MRSLLPVKHVLASITLLLSAAVVFSADLPGSKDPDGMKRFEGSSIVAYRAPQFDEFVLPLGRLINLVPPKFSKSLALQGLVSRYTYSIPEGISPTEAFQNYKDEFSRLGLTTLYQEGPGNTSYSNALNSSGQEDGLNNLFQGSAISDKD